MEQIGDAISFCYYGNYRTQSHREPVSSALEGVWLANREGIMTRDTVNHALSRNQLWLGKNGVSLMPAYIKYRTGAFKDEADSLYYQEYFTPNKGYTVFPGDILDVSKLLDHWNTRKEFNILLLGEEAYEHLAGQVGDIVEAGVNEYMCHEAGHMLGWDIRQKYQSGYFKQTGKTAWPLVYVEEFRADLEGLRFALDVLPPEACERVILYHFLHRFGLATYSMRTQSPGAGAVCYLLFCLLYDLEAISVNSSKKVGRLIVHFRGSSEILDLMHALGEHSFNNFTSFEFTKTSSIDIAIQAAKYFRERILDDQKSRMYNEILMG